MAGRMRAAARRGSFFNLEESRACLNADGIQSERRVEFQEREKINRRHVFLRKAREGEIQSSSRDGGPSTFTDRRKG